jgi:hypothetical protein
MPSSATMIRQANETRLIARCSTARLQHNADMGNAA